MDQNLSDYLLSQSGWSRSEPQVMVRWTATAGTLTYEVIHFVDKVYYMYTSFVFRYLLGKYSTDIQKTEFLRPTVESLALETKFDRLGNNFFQNFPYSVCRVIFHKIDLSVRSGSFLFCWLEYTS
jgi:hypothetical protein